MYDNLSGSLQVEDTVLVRLWHRYESYTYQKVKAA